MKHIFLNLKRFDISPENGGVNRIAPMTDWGAAIVRGTQKTLATYDPGLAEFVMYLPEAHLLGAASALDETGAVRLGCQGVYRDDTSVGGNFGAFTTSRTANAAKELGCKSALIGHCEERADKAGVLAEAGVADPDAVSRLLNREVLAAQKAGLSVLFCIGEKAQEQAEWENVLGHQLDIGLKDAVPGRTVIAYEPVWSIGPGKTPADREYITKVARFVKARTGDMDVVYGGGLKAENAAMIASIPEVDGGLIALTRFSGVIGFYPNEYLEIIRLYLAAA
ncbi:MAG: triosephosphate isomerase [Clostridiales bacterium]|nr:triosephosphate isomerase [Clostridiales bacterium]